jgi:hypothetical protein
MNKRKLNILIILIVIGIVLIGFILIRSGERNFSGLHLIPDRVNPDN